MGYDDGELFYNAAQKKYVSEEVNTVGRFVNPNNSAFQKATNAEIYVDKTGLIEVTNRFL